MQNAIRKSRIEEDSCIVVEGSGGSSATTDVIGRSTQMMVSTRGRYALRLMIDIAKQGEEGTLVTMRQAAERQGLSVKYLEQLGGALVRAGVLKSVRGVNGGYYLAYPPNEIIMGDVLRATEGSCRLVSCLDDENACERYRDCEASAFWRGMSEALERYMDSVTLADVLGGKVEV